MGYVLSFPGLAYAAFLALNFIPVWVDDPPEVTFSPSLGIRSPSGFSRPSFSYVSPQRLFKVGFRFLGSLLPFLSCSTNFPLLVHPVTEDDDFSSWSSPVRFDF